MLQKESIIYVSDKTGVIRGRIFHIYKGFVKKHGRVGDVVKLSVREKSPLCFFKKGRKFKAAIVRANFIENRMDGSYIRFFENGCVLLKRRMSTKAKVVLGPASRSIKKKKFVYNFGAQI